MQITVNNRMFIFPGPLVTHHQLCWAADEPDTALVVEVTSVPAGPSKTIGDSVTVVGGEVFVVAEPGKGMPRSMRMARAFDVSSMASIISLLTTTILPLITGSSSAGTITSLLGSLTGAASTSSTTPATTTTTTTPTTGTVTTVADGLSQLQTILSQVCGLAGVSISAGTTTGGGTTTTSAGGTTTTAIPFDLSNGLPASPDAAEIDQFAAYLSPADALDLRVKGRDHNNIWNLKLHTAGDCPIINFMLGGCNPKNQSNPLAYAKSLKSFYDAKHDQDDNCECNADIKAGTIPTGVSG